MGRIPKPPRRCVRSPLACLMLVGCAGFASNASAAFPGENGRIAFSAHSEIWFVGENPRVATSITTRLPGAGFGEPSFSSDGNQMAFTRGGDVFVIDVDGSDLVRLTHDGINREPAFSPDGQIAFVRSLSLGGGTFDRDIYSVDADGTDLTPLLTGPSDDAGPAFSPDGDQIVFVRRPEPSGPFDREADIHVMKADGSEVTHLIDGEDSLVAEDGEWRVSPSFTPDGQRVVFTELGLIRTIGVDGSDPGSLPGSPPYSLDEEAIVSPDGNRLLTTSYFDVETPGGVESWWRIYTRALDGSDRKIGAPLPFQYRDFHFHPATPDWAPATADEPTPQGRCRRQATTIAGTRFADMITGTSGRDVIAGRGGEDVIDGGGGKDLICAGPGRDRIAGGPGRDTLLGNDGDDHIDGGGGDDRALGGPGHDDLFGRAGQDVLKGHGGFNLLDGGAQTDKCDRGARGQLRNCELRR